jgi:hypothetical protein
MTNSTAHLVCLNLSLVLQSNDRVHVRVSVRLPPLHLPCPVPWPHALSLLCVLFAPRAAAVLELQGASNRELRSAVPCITPFNSEPCSACP